MATEQTWIEKFWRFVNKNGPTPKTSNFKCAPAGQCWQYNEQTGLYEWVGGPCWLWTGPVNKAGYGMFRGQILAHRFAIEKSWGISLNDIFEKAGVEFDPMHQCDRPACVRPSHFWFGTHAENMLDRAEKGRANHSEETKRKIGAANAIALVGHKQSEETRHKRTESLKRAYAEGRHKGRHDISTEEAARFYEQGATLKELAARYNCSIASIHRRLTNFGAKLRFGANQFSKKVA